MRRSIIYAAQRRAKALFVIYRIMLSYVMSVMKGTLCF